MNNWQQQFDEEFVMFNGQYIEPEFRDKSDVGPVKNFINTLLEKQREEIVEEIKMYAKRENKIYHYESNTIDCITDDIINLIKSHDNTQT